MGYRTDGPAPSGPRGHCSPEPGHTDGKDRKASCLGGFQTACLEVQMAGADSSVPFRASARLFYEITGTFISGLAPFSSFSARLQRRQRGENKERRPIRGRSPAGQGHLACASSSLIPLNLGDREGSTGDQVKRGPFPLGAWRKLQCILGRL